MTHIAYLRVSTYEQGNGLNAQRDAINSKYQCSRVFRDVTSGSTSIDKCPGLLAAISSLKKNDILVVAKRDRLSRDTIKTAMIESLVTRKHATIESATETATNGSSPESALMKNMVNAFADYERLIIGARTKAALQAKKSRGERVGHIGYGYQLCSDSVHIETCQDEQDNIKYIKNLKGKGWSFRAILEQLKMDNKLNRGVTWKYSALRNVIQKAA